LYFGLPENLSIKESNKQNFTFQDLRKLMMGFSNMKTRMNTENAALWAIERFLEKATSIAWKGIQIDIRMDEYVKKHPEYSWNGDELISEIKKIILSFEEDVLSPSSISVRLHYQNYNPVIIFNFSAI